MIFSRQVFATGLFAAAAATAVTTVDAAFPISQEHRKQQQETNILVGCVEDHDPDVEIDYFPHKYNKPIINSYGDVDIFGEQFVPHNTTDLLDIEYFGTYKIVYNHFQNTSYLLYQCGTEPPQEEVESGKHHLIISVPHEGKLALTETVQITPIELLGLREEVIGYLDDPQWITSPCINSMIENGMIDVVWKGWGSPEQAPAMEAWLANHTDAIILGGPFGNASAPGVLSIAASQERTNVATFDWLALYAALYNLEAVSNRIAAEAQEDYDCSANNAQIVAEQQRRTLQVEDKRPVLLWASYFDGYNWSVAECPTWDTTYYCEYAAHCDTEILSRPEGAGDCSTGFCYLNDEEFLEFGKDADIWIYSSQFWDDMYEQKKDIVDQFKSVQNQQVYDTQGQGPNAWYEQRLAEYDVVGFDICHIVGNVNPNAPPHTLRWLRNIYTDPVGDGFPTCNVPDELSEPYIPGGKECVPMEASPPSEASSFVMWQNGIVLVVSTVFGVLLTAM